MLNCKVQAIHIQSPSLQSPHSMGEVEFLIQNQEPPPLANKESNQKRTQTGHFLKLIFSVWTTSYTCVPQSMTETVLS